MGFLNQLRKSTSSTSILALDPSIRKTGYCLLRYIDDEPEIRSIGLFSSNEEKDDEFRIMQIAFQVAAFVKNLDKTRTVVAIEKPPFTMYESKFSKSHIIARAASLFLTFAMYGALVSTVRSKLFPLVPVLPIDWQKKLKRKDFDIKDLSKSLANSRIEGKLCDFDGRVTSKPLLRTKDDENIADAINIAFHVWSNREKLLGNIFQLIV